MVEQSPHSRPDLSALWAEYKELTSRRLPERSGRFVRSRRFDRLLVAYALYSCVILGITAIGLFAGAELLDHVLGWWTDASR